MRMGISGLHKLTLVLAIALLLLAQSSPFVQSGSQNGTVGAGSPGLYTNGVSVYDNFTSVLSVNNNVNKVVVGDFNSDGKKDLVVTYVGQNLIYMYNQTANGLFGQPWIITFSNAIIDIAVADMAITSGVQKDTKDDIVVCYKDASSCKMSILFQSELFKSLGHDYSIFALTWTPLAMVIGDFDKDGYNDTVVTFSPENPSTTNVRFGLFLKSENFISIDSKLMSDPSMDATRLITSGDFDSDGRLDLAFADEAANRMDVWRNGGSYLSDWTLMGSVQISQPKSLATLTDSNILPADRPDRILISSRGDSKAWLMRYYGGTIQVVSEIPSQNGITYATTFSLNNDGREDVAILTDTYNLAHYFTTPSNYIFPSSATGEFPTPSSPFLAIPSDMNSDGTEDLVVCSKSSATAWSIVVHYSIGQRISNANDNIKSTSGFDSVLVGNFTGVRQSIGVLDSSVELMRFYESGAWYSIPTGTTDSYSAFSASLSDPSHQDIVLIDNVNNKLSFFTHGASFSSMTGPSYWLNIQIGSSSNLEIVDVNNDGLKDVVLSGNGFQIFLQQSTGQQFTNSSVEVYPRSAGHPFVTTGNFNNDAMIDIALVNLVNYTIDIYYQQSTGPRFLMTPSVILSSVSNAVNLCSSDLNKDGIDELALFTTTPELRVYYRLVGSGFSDINKYSTTPSFGLARGIVNDFDDDGYDEIVTVGSKSPVVSLIELEGSIFTTKYRHIGGAGPNLVVVGDADGDHRSDVVLTSAGSDAISLFYQRNTYPVARWTISPSSPVEGSSTLLDASASSDSVSDNSSLNYEWWVRYPGETSDRLLANGQDKKTLSPTFYSDGSYRITLIVTDRGGLSNSSSKLITIEDAGPTASFNVNTYPALVEGNNIGFVDLSTSPADGIIWRNWTWGDGDYNNYSSSINPSHSYGGQGTYIVRLMVCDSDGDISTFQRSVDVADAVPTAYYTVSHENAAEGSTITFNGAGSYSPVDGIKRYEWNFYGSELKTGMQVDHLFPNSGTFWVELTVIENDNSVGKYNRTVTIVDSSPNVGALGTSDGKSSYVKSSNVTFVLSNVVVGTEQYSYRWIISSSSGQVTSSTTSVPSFYWTFAESGSYTIVVRVSDLDNYVERSLGITIIDTPPVVDVDYSIDIDALRVVLSANQTYDPDGDNSLLEYQWNFGDGTDWTAWSSTDRYISHTYSDPGVYSITLRVRDSHNTVVWDAEIVLDRFPPQLYYDDITSKGEVDEPVTIKLRVWDHTPVTVVMYYSIDGVNFTSVQMLPSDSEGNYTCQIPAFDDELTVWYYFTATDENDNVVTSETFQMQIEFPPSMLIYWVLAISIAIILLLIIIYLMVTKPVVDEVFVIYHDGNLITHQARRMKPGMDDQILGSMLVALQGFVMDSFKDETSTMLKRMDFGDKTIMVERGDFIYIAVVLNGKRNSSVPPKMERIIELIDERYGIELIAWDGDLERLRGIKDLTKPLFARNSLSDVRIIKRKKKA